MADAPKSQETKSWQARIGEATDAIAQTFVESMSYDWRLYKVDVAGSIAHATMLEKVGLITGADREAIYAGLKEIETEIDRDGPKWAGFKPELEDIHMCVESALTERIGEPGRKLHTGRSRNDQVAFDLAYWITDSSRALASGVQDLMRAFFQLAERSAAVVMPSFTHLQRAQPISAGAEALAWAEMLQGDYNRIDYAQKWASFSSPLGSGAIAGTSLPIDPLFTTDIVEGPEFTTGRTLQVFATDPVNSIERTASRDAACDFVYACAMIAQHLSRWAEQWIIYMTTEFGFIKIADRYTTSSSMMPQKRNPDMLELIRGRCGNVYGDLFALMTILKGLPIGYNRDLQEDKRIVFRAYDTVSQCLTMAAAIVNSASYDKARIEPTLDRGFLDATSLAEYLVTLGGKGAGIPFRTAHHIVGTLVARCEKEGKHSLAQLSVEAFNEVIASSVSVVGGRHSVTPNADVAGPKAAGTAALHVTDDVYTCLGAANVVKRYQSAGAAGGKPFEDQLAAWKQRLGV